MSGEVVELRPGYPATVAIDAGEGYGCDGWVVFIAHGELHRTVWCGTFDRYGDALDVAIARSEALGGVRIIDFQAAGDDRPLCDGATAGIGGDQGAAVARIPGPWAVKQRSECEDAPRSGYALIAADYPVEPEDAP